MYHPRQVKYIIAETSTCTRSHARVISGIIQANLIHLSIKIAMPHQSGAPFVGERVFQNRGVCGQALPSFPSPNPLLPPFCSRPIFHAARMQKPLSLGPNFVRIVRERLLRRLSIQQKHLFSHLSQRKFICVHLNMARKVTVSKFNCVF